jgi:hypothetical protein
MINFLAEVARRFKGHILPTPSNSRKIDGIIATRMKNIYELDINTHPKQSYWIDWGGEYDCFASTQIELYYTQFLLRVNSVNELIILDYSFYVGKDGFAYMNIPKHPWLYADHETEAEYLLQFLSAALDPGKPSNNNLRGEKALVKLEVPNFTVKLSDNISGIVLNQGFSISLHNNDGYFDSDLLWNLFNTPVYLKKAVKDNPEYRDFKNIRTGFADNTQVNFDNIKIDISDKHRAMEEPVCDIIEAAKFPNITIDADNFNKNIPIIYGRKKIRLQKLNEGIYLTAEYVTEIIGVYNGDGQNINYTVKRGNYTVIVAENADTADIIGWPCNRIGEIIKDLIERKANVAFNGTNVNISEWERYNEEAFSVNMLFESGNVKNAIQAVLKNDMAFLIQQNDGRLTIRKYNRVYSKHRLPTWTTTKKPEKTWASAQQNFFSSCIINYNEKKFLFADAEREAEDTYRRRVRKTFDTDLFITTEAAQLAETLSARYTTMKQTLKLAVGTDTSSFELMDWVIYDSNINGRKFSSGDYFFIKEVNPAQDILVLEELNITDITGEYPDTVKYFYNVNGLFADTRKEQFRYIIEGGIQ